MLRKMKIQFISHLIYTNNDILQSLYRFKNINLMAPALQSTNL